MSCPNCKSVHIRVYLITGDVQCHWCGETYTPVVPTFNEFEQEIIDNTVAAFFVGDDEGAAKFMAELAAQSGQPPTEPQA